MVRLETRPTDVSAGILGRTRTLPIRSAKSSANSRLTQRSLTVSIAARNSKKGQVSGDPSANSAARQPRVASTNRSQPELEEGLPEPRELQEQLELSGQPQPVISRPSQQQQQELVKSQPPSIRSVTPGLASRMRRLNSGVSNSVNSFGGGSESNTGDDSVQLPEGWRYGRRSLALTRRRLGKSVSITSVRESRTRDEIDRSAGASGGPSTQNPSELQTTRSIIKMRRLSDELPVLSWHNVDLGTSGKGDAGPTPHQQREQKIFDECRFIPTDTFYKKVLIAPNQDRQFFASPKCNRVPGSNMLYDIANQNPMHHRDVNFDFTRDSLRKVCSTFCRTSQFRHPGY